MALPIAAEVVQELGRNGVLEVKRWLEATTFIELPFDVYNRDKECAVRYRDDADGPSFKRLDLCGHYIETSIPIRIECKRYSTPGGQYTEFQKLLAIIYSSEVLEIEEYSKSSGAHYFWITSHPFNLENWATLERHEQVTKALERYPQVLLGAEIDQDLIRDIADRISVLVFSQKQIPLILSREELLKTKAALNRKGKFE